ncbi:hypothetical protein BCR37DRAFT_231340 [Protomyces lactucae-debilis]|uniref:Uncharacterized protein n=1 Tax=Protomyces lactucae-debilis TaxID=2754530 RepID=A0A1Y2EQ70_PROLT|nr:uncharacterized protein BCR37DRAFT_231340 [Protomyces lactucae-debilis]ORY73699.1 hypothetical protein BCR37DRAFT_231340 [Protomyces lactucae-debilis]
MADKEAKLAAAKKRAAELKAKKKQSVQEESSAVDSKATEDSAEVPADSLAVADATKEKADETSDGQEALLVSNTAASSKELTELKASHEAAINLLKAELATLQATSKENVQPVTHSEEALSELKANADIALQAAAKAEAKVTELQTKNATLQSENRSILQQLTEMRSHLMQLQDEKLALVENMERLKQETAHSANRHSSTHRKLSKEFDRSAALQDVSLDSGSNVVPEVLKQGIQIDLTGWYDKHAGVVIEV